MDGSQTKGDGPRRPTRSILFEVTLPGDPLCQKLRIPADNWIEAWQAALRELDEPAEPKDVLCVIHPGDCIIVRVRSTGRRLVVRSLGRTQPEAPAEPASAVPGLPARRRRKSGRGRVLQSRQRTRDSIIASPVVSPTSRAEDGAAHVPYVGQLGEDPDEAIHDALVMLERHVECEAIQFLLPARRGRMEVAAEQSRGELERVGWRLSLDQPLLRFLSSGPARIKLQGEGTALVYTRKVLRRSRRMVGSILAVPIIDEGRLLGALLLLNAQRRSGFSEGELSAVVYLARLLAQRMASSAANLELVDLAL